MIQFTFHAWINLVLSSFQREQYPREHLSTNETILLFSRRVFFLSSIHAKRKIFVLTDARIYYTYLYHVDWRGPLVTTGIWALALVLWLAC